MIKDVGFRIKVPLAKETTESQKSIDKFRKGFVDMEKKDIPKLHKTTKEYLVKTKDGLKELARESDSAGRSLKGAFEGALVSMNRFEHSLGKVKHSLINVKTVLAGTAIGGLAALGAHALYKEGKKQALMKEKLDLQISDAQGGMVGERDIFDDVSKRLGKRTGMKGDDASEALLPLYRSIAQIQEGSKFRGMKALTASQAFDMRGRNLDVGAELIGRLGVARPDIEAGELGRVAADALTGREGIRRLLSTFDLGKNSQKLALANEQGRVFEELSPTERKTFGITKKGQHLESADEIKAILERSKITEASTEAKRNKLDFQIRAIGNTAEDALGEIGAIAIEKFNKGLKEGESVSERFSKYLEDNKESIHKFGEGLAGAAEGVFKLASYLPSVGSFLSEHKASLLAVGAAFYGFKGLSAIGGAIDNVKKLPGVGEVLGGGGITKVWVTNPGFGGASPLPTGAVAAGGLAAGAAASVPVVAALGAVAAHDYLLNNLDLKKSGLKLQASLAAGEQKSEKSWFPGMTSYVDVPMASRKIAAEEYRKSLGKDFDSLPEAIRMLSDIATGRAAAPTTIVVKTHIDGKQVGETVVDHHTRAVKRATAGGAARADGR